MASTSSRLSGLFLNEPPLRLIVEAVVFALVLATGVLVTSNRLSGEVFLQMLVIGPLAAMYLAARMRLNGSGMTTRLDIEMLSALALTAIMAVVGIIATRPDFLVASLRNQFFFTIFLSIWTMGTFVFFRILAYLWPAWRRLRRSRLRWEMTHTILLVVIPIVAALMLVVALLFLLGGGFFAVDAQAGPLQRAMMALPVVGILIFLTVIAVGILIPPIALASYFAARKTANRLESLSHGTGGLRYGNYSIRVTVDGEDEISTVQRDFNLMAGNLEQTIQELRDERDNVEHLLHTQRELVANVSHELRTPVATLRGYLESALDGGQQHGSANLRDDLQIMSGEVARLQRLIDDLFVLTRTEAGNLPLTIEPTDVTRVVSASVAAVAEQGWRTGRVEVVEDIEPGAPWALADAGRLEQVIRNLLANAIRHTPPGGIVAASVRVTGDSLVIDVKDTGDGIPAEHQTRIFERFQRLDNARERDPSGAGLGLAIVLELTEAMGGTVSVTSEPGSGSCFSITLPVAVRA